MQRIAWIHVQFGTAKAEYYRRAIGRICARLSVSSSVFVIENNATSGRISGVIVGTNALREFSGWNEGLVQADRNGRFDWYIFTNDTFAHHRFFWGTLFYRFVHQFRRVRFQATPTVIGDLVPGKLLEREGPSYLYASTYFFMVNDAALNCLNRDLVADAPLHWITDAPRGQLTADTCPPMVSDFLAMHLTSETSSHRWRQAAILTEENASQLRFKALAVLLEHWLSYRMSLARVQMVPVIDRVRRNAWRLLRSIEVMVTRRWK